MEVTAEAVKEVRTRTNAGMLDCKKALDKCGGDIAGAIESLRQKGFAMAEKRAERVVSEGIVAAYVHHNNRVAALVELNCETDFVARTDDFRRLAYDIAMHVVGASPSYLAPEDRPADCQTPAEESCLLAQPFIKDPSKTIADLITEAIARTGENIKIGRFARVQLGC
ncbi:MAG: translation elongation factor Ts [Dehalococcoidia bacterium]|jgi:elongation factor Ts|nr:translation elongation factor Ts [Dehalococcoidia bacterium]